MRQLRQDLLRDLLRLWELLLRRGLLLLRELVLRRDLLRDLLRDRKLLGELLL